MRLKTIHIDSFRGIKSHTSFFLDSDLILIKGENGTGKTSIIDAFQWIITGKVNRIHGSRDFIAYKNGYKNVMSEGLPTIELEFTKNGSNYNLIRIGRENGDTNSLLLRKDGKNVPEEEVELLLRKLFPDNYWTQYVLLEQHNLSQFVTNSNPRSRYDLFIKFLGLEDYTDLRKLIQNTITRLTKKIETFRANFDEVEEIREFPEEFDKELFLDRIDTQIIRKIELNMTDFKEGINFKPEAQKFELNEKVSKYFSFPKVISSINIVQIRRSFSNKYDQLKIELRNYKKELNSLQKVIERGDNEKYRKENINELQYNENNLKDRRAALQNSFKPINDIIKEIKDQIKIGIEEPVDLESSKQEEFNQLVRWGRQFIEHSYICPLCESHLDFDLEKKLDSVILKYQKQLEIMKNRENELKSKLKEYTLNLNELSSEIVTLDGEISKNKRKISVVESEMESLRLAILNIIKEPENNQDTSYLFTELGKHKDDTEVKIRHKETEIDHIENTRTFVSILSDSYKQTLKEIKYSEERKERLGREIQNNIELSESLKESLAHLLEKEKSLVKYFISIINDDFHIIYNKLNPHPYFNEVEIKIDYKQPGGEIYFLSNVKFEDIPRSDDFNIKNIFSTTQNNILALSVFLAINQQINKLERIPIILDDPVQSMDSQNLIKIVEMLTTLSVQQQIILTTSSERFFVLLKRYFQYLTENSTLTEHALYDWSKEGPVRKEKTIKSLARFDSIKTIFPSLKTS